MKRLSQVSKLQVIPFVSSESAMSTLGQRMIPITSSSTELTIADENLFVFFPRLMDPGHGLSLAQIMISLNTSSWPELTIADESIIVFFPIWAGLECRIDPGACGG